MYKILTIFWLVSLTVQGQHGISNDWEQVWIAAPVMA